MILQVGPMTKTRINQYFNPDQHLVLHQDKDGNMIGGGYQVNNLLYQHKMPLFVSLDDGRQIGGASASGGGSNGSCDEHFIPERFSDLFKDLAVPAGLFMMPALFRPRNYVFEVPEADMDAKPHKDKDKEKDNDDADSDESDTDSDDEHHKTKTVPNDIFDTLLSLVTPSERIQHDVKTRRRRQEGELSGKKRQNKTKRAKA